MSVDTEEITPAPEPGGADVIVHCSDLHFGSGFLPRRADDLLAHINEVAPDLVVVSGDLTMRARAEQFEAAREFLRQVKAPLLVVPGNHDVPLYDLWQRITGPFANYRKYIADLNTGPVTLRHVGLFDMNTVNPRSHQRGKFRLLEFIELEKWSKELAESAWKLAVVHQHFANIPGHERPGAFRFGEKILNRMSTAGIHAVLHGHVHYHHVVSSAEFFPEMERPLVLVSAGTPTSLRTRGAIPTNNFNILHFYQDYFEVHQCDWIAEDKGFELSRHVKFDRRFFLEEVE